MAREALIAGLGLIGGSIALALQRRGWRVRYFDPHVETDAFPRAERIEAADVVVLATPVDVAVAQLRALEGDTLVTSVCSVMRPLREVARGRFVAGHPMAGSHERGFAAAKADLFEGTRWFVDAEEPIVNDLVRDCGATLERVEAEEHDRAVALTSHLPQVLSTALAAYLAEQDVLRFAGTGLQTFLRLAGSDASVWAPILEANRDQLAPHAEELAELVRQIVAGDPREAFARAQELYARLKWDK